MIQKQILDATCGARMMWFDKHNPHVLYVDKRILPETRLCDGRKFDITPDATADFTALPYPDKSFKLVVFDPPHLKTVNETAYMAIKYGKLPKDWQPMIREGFNECMRVLDDYGTLIFKWSEVQIPTKQVIAAIGVEPLFGHISGKANKTHWMAFMRGVSA